MENGSPEERAKNDVRNLRRRHAAYVRRVTKRREKGDTALNSPVSLREFIEGKTVEDTFGRGMKSPMRPSRLQKLAERSTKVLTEPDEQEARYRTAYADELARWFDDRTVTVHDAISSSSEKPEQKSYRTYTHRPTLVQQQLDL